MCSLFLAILFVLGLALANVSTTPVPENVTIINSTSTTFLNLDEMCNDVDEVISNDPCKPLCICKDSRIYCADIVCSLDNLPLENCLKLPVNGKCCPSYLCTTGNSTGDIHYPLPVLMIPPELNIASVPLSKAEILYKAKRV